MTNTNIKTEIALVPTKNRETMTFRFREFTDKGTFFKRTKYQIFKLLTAEQKENLELAERVKKIYDNRKYQFAKYVELNQQCREDVRLHTMMKCFQQKNFTIL